MSLSATCFWEVPSDVSGEAGHAEVLYSQPGWLHLSYSSPPSPPPPSVCYDDCNPVKPAESVNLYALSILAVIVIQIKKIW